MNHPGQVDKWARRHEGLMDMIGEVHDRLDEIEDEVRALNRAGRLDGDEAEGYTVEDWSFYLAEIQWKAEELSTSLLSDVGKGEEAPDLGYAEDAPVRIGPPGPVGLSSEPTGSGAEGPQVVDATRPTPVGTGIGPALDYKERLRQMREAMARRDPPPA